MGTRRISTEHGSFTLFFTRRSPFSNFHPAKFEARGIDLRWQIFNCVEQFYEYNKAVTYHCYKESEDMMLEKDPKVIKSMGAYLKDHDGRWDIEWQFLKQAVMNRALEAKFSQNEHLLYLLFLTKDTRLVECSPTDAVWGIGISIDDIQAGNPNQWKGQNLLGNIMGTVRDRLWNDHKYRKIRGQAELTIRTSKNILNDFEIALATAHRYDFDQMSDVRSDLDGYYNYKKRSFNMLNSQSHDELDTLTSKRMRMSSPIREPYHNSRPSRVPNKINLNKTKRHRSDSPSPVRRVAIVETDLRIKRKYYSQDQEEEKESVEKRDNTISSIPSKVGIDMKNVEKNTEMFCGIESGQINKRVSGSAICSTGIGNKENKLMSDVPSLNKKNERMATIDVLMSKMGSLV
ncbi:unnamed protein product [Auanema sp. JU1783]|nr:unnamed protein product [Auanema sp. JU1783]